jgi:exonuclease III
MTDKLKILSLNCRGLKGTNKRQQVFNYLKETKCSIYCLQDTHFTQDMLNDIHAEWGGDFYSSFGTSNSRGTAILFSKNIDFKIHKQLSDENGNYLAIDLSYGESRFTLLNVYGPNNDTPAFYTRIFNLIDCLGNGSVIICGDFNLVLNPELDYYNYKNTNNPNARDRLIECMYEYNLVDPFREKYPYTKRYTWRRSSPLQQARLDFFLLSADVFAFFESISIQPSLQSDHSLIILELTFNQFQHVPGLWKHNNALLLDIEYINEIKNKICQIKKQYALPIYNLDHIDLIPDNELCFTVDDQLFLETLLMEIRRKSISYASFKKKMNENNEKDIISKINVLEQTLTETNIQELNTLKCELNNISEQKLKGHQIRAKATWIVEGEKPTKYFCNLEKQRAAVKTIYKLEDDDGKVTTEQKEILNIVSKFYQNLYQKQGSCESNMFLDFVEDFNCPKLSKQNSQNIEGKISLPEATTVLKNMSNNKSPGSSGFTAEFYKVFWNQLGCFVVRALNEAFNNGKLSITQTQGIITCIPKGDKSKLFLKNWRPITLLNTIYKIGSGVIANRIKTCMDHLIHYDQTGFIKGRYIGENTRLIFDIMHQTEEQNIPGLLLLIDFEKAFDSLSWAFVQKTLSFFNFGPDIKRWFEVFYSEAKSAVVQCGHLSNFFPIQRGCRQGDPLSCYIFVLCAEILSIKIRSNNNIKGITLNNIEHKLSQFADDTTVILDGSEISLNETLLTLQNFSNISGLKVNFDKTKIVWIGKKKFSSDSIKTKWKLQWNQQQFQMLGIHFHVDLSKILELNYKEKIIKMRNTLSNWKKRNLTPIGKITVIRTLLISLFNHLFISLPSPSLTFIKQLNDAFLNFIWDGQSRINFHTLCKEYKDGGLKMVNVENFIKAMKLTWLKRVFVSNGKWLHIAKSYIDFDKLVHCGKHYSEKLENEILNPFWKDVLQCFIQFQDKLDFIPANVYYYPVFYNDSIKIGNKSIYFDSWYKAGIHLIGDLFDDNGTFLSLKEINNKYNLNINFLLYSGVKQAIRAHFKNEKIEQKHKTNSYIERPFIPDILKIILKPESGAKRMYDVLNASNSIMSVKEKWASKIQITVSDEEWEKLFLMPFKINKEARLQWFQYRIVHRIIGTNYLLYKMNISNSPLCTFCNNRDETIEHLFWYCPATKHVIDDIFPIRIIPQCNIKNFILGYTDKMDYAINNMFIFTKLYIYQCKMSRTSPTTDGAKHYIRKQFENQRNAALYGKYQDKFDLSWRDIQDKITFLRLS